MEIQEYLTKTCFSCSRNTIGFFCCLASLSIFSKTHKPGADDKSPKNAQLHQEKKGPKINTLFIFVAVACS